MLKSTLLALCLMTFISGCVKTETVIVTKKVATLPPPYLYESESIPQIPAGLSPGERTPYLLEGYASRGDALKRGQSKAQLMEQWVQHIRSIYPDAVVESLPEVEAEADDTESTGDGET